MKSTFIFALCAAVCMPTISSAYFAEHFTATPYTLSEPVVIVQQPTHEYIINNGVKYRRRLANVSVNPMLTSKEEEELLFELEESLNTLPEFDFTLSSTFEPTTSWPSWIGVPSWNPAE